MSAQTHHIRLQRLHINALSGDGFALKRKVESLMQEMPEKMATLFDGLVGVEEYMQLDKLNIDLGYIAENQLEEELPRLLLKNLREKIEEQKQQVTPGGSLTGNTWLPGQQQIKALVFFLKHGTLPWWFKPLSHQRWENDLLLALSKPGTVPGEQNPELSRHLFIQLQKTLQTTAARERLSEQFSQEVFWAVVETLFTHNKQKGFLQLFASWTEINQTAWKDWTRASVELVLSEKKLKQLLLEACSAEDISTDYLTLFLSKILTYDANEQKTIRMEVLTASVWVKKIFPEGVTEKIKEYIYKHTEQAKEDRAVKKEELVLPETKQQQQSAKEKKMEEVEQKDGIYVNNGGAVILATYLPMFFNRCGLCEDEKQLTNSDKAIALLHYLVTGHTAYREYEVVLYKTLCGLEMEKTVQLITELTNEEKELAEGLLTAVIQNWPILKNTSVEALRETFLQREAKLMVAPDAAMLKVERKTVDILIDQLPWTISMIKLPWMKKLLKVEW